MAPNPIRPPLGRGLALALCGAMILSACSAKYTEVPPRLDLHSFGRVALVQFSVEQADTGMGVVATERFAEELLASQRVELLEVGSADSAISSLAAREVPAVFVGHLKVSSLRPRGQLSASSVNLRGTVSAELVVRLVSTRDGATLWRSSAVTTGTLGRLAVGSGFPSVSVRDPGEAYGEIFRELAVHATRDLRPTWVRQ
ncbi:MAG TPA: hypothetical protein VF037_08870 [Gemmatimonadales bacterium]